MAIRAVDTTFDVTLAGARFRVQQRGLAPAVVFLHGFGADLFSWDLVWECLPAGFPALRYDLRGFGASAAEADDEFSHSDDLLAILDDLGIGRCHLVGVSMGGAIAVNFALGNPDRVEKLVLISPALVAWEWSAEWRALWRPIVDQARAGNMDGARDLWWRHPLFESTRASAAAGDLRQAIEGFAGRQWLRDQQRPALPDVERLHLLQCPVLLLTGDRDLADFRLVADVLEAAAPTLERVDFPGRGHCLHLEDPAGVVRHLLPFLKSDT